MLRIIHHGTKHIDVATVQTELAFATQIVKGSSNDNLVRYRRVCRPGVTRKHPNGGNKVSGAPSGIVGESTQQIAWDERSRVQVFHTPIEEVAEKVDARPFARRIAL